MLIENMKMAFSAIRINKMRSFLTMLGIIIGIGSVKEKLCLWPMDIAMKLLIL